MTCRLSRLAPLLFLVAAQALIAQESKPPDEIDVAKSPRVYGTHFGRYGKYPAKVIRFDNRFVRFAFPSGGKSNESDQYGVYSYFSFAGDFEVAADYEIRSQVAPEKGYGSSIGITLEPNGSGQVQLMRGFSADKPTVNGYIFNRAVVEGNDTKYEVAVFPSAAKRGKLGLRREGGELILLAADKWTDPWKELSRVPFTNGKIAKLRLVADRGGDDNAYDSGIGNLKVRADEIAGGLPKDELGAGPNWLRIVCLLVLASGIGFFVQKWRRGHREKE